MSSVATARQKLPPSHLDLTQAELLGDVLDIDSLILTLANKVHTDLRKAITDVIVERTIEGASTVTVSLDDHSRKILREGNLKEKLDIELNGLFFRLAGVNKQGDGLDLIFEEREIALLRTYVNPPTFLISRQYSTRAEFVVKLLKEVKELRIPYVIPQLHKVQPIVVVGAQGSVPASTPAPGTPGAPGSPGISSEPQRPDSNRRGRAGTTGGVLTVKGETATPEQIRNANSIIAVGESLGARRKVLVVSIMVAIQESTIHNYDSGKPEKAGGHIGVYQQSPSWGSFGDRTDVPTAARLFFGGNPSNGIQGAIEIDKSDPGLSYFDLGEAVQHSGLPHAYAPWRTEAERFVTAYGAPGGDTTSTDATTQFNSNTNPVTTDSAYYFYRGIPPTSTGQLWQKETSWDCIQRLADEVRWRAFFVSGVFYFMDEFTLFRSKPRMTLREDIEGVNAIDFNYDNAKKAAKITAMVHLARWGAPPGSVVLLEGMGPLDGRWLTEAVRRSIFSPYATITLSKPRPKLPEPLGPDLPGQAGSSVGSLPGRGGQLPAGRGSYRVLVSDGLSFAGVDQGIDFTGTGTIYAPASGVITKVIPFGTGWPGRGALIVLDIGGGRYIYFTEDVVPANIQKGQSINKGDVIATLDSRYPGCEIGWCDANGTPLAPLYPNPHSPKAEGSDFQNWILNGGG